MGDMDPEYLFVYGTLRAGAGTPQAARLAREAISLGRAHAAGRLLLIGSYPGLVAGTGRVTGEVYQLDAPAPVLLWLDRYEGPRFRREVHPVQLAAGGELEAWVYRYAGPAAGLPAVPGNDFLASG